MSDAPKFDRPEDDVDAGSPGHSPAAAGAEEEALEGLLVLGEQNAVLRSVSASPVRTVAPAVQAAAVAAGGFVAGAAIVGLVHRRHRSGPFERRRAGKRARRRSSGPAAELIQIVGSRSLLVDVHLLGGSAGGSR